ncbi:MAG: hypothetical protein NVSMB14_05070 [Isosphaeraceae bacterium]
MSILDSLERIVLAECEEDHVGLWSIIRDVEEFLIQPDDAAVRNQVLGLLNDLLVADEIIAGFPTPEGRFCPLRMSAEKIMARIETEWPAGHRPNIGEGLWFTRSKKQDPEKPGS